MCSMNNQPMLYGPLLRQTRSMNVASGYEPNEWQRVHEYFARDMCASYSLFITKFKYALFT